MTIKLTIFPFLGRNRAQGVGPVDTFGAQDVAGAARLHQQEGGQNLWRRCGQCREECTASNHQSDPCEKHEWIQLAFTVKISVLFYRTESP